MCTCTTKVDKSALFLLYQTFGHILTEKEIYGGMGSIIDLVPGIIEAKLDGSIEGLSHQGWT